MNDLAPGKSTIFAAFVLIAYGIHQATVGGDGVVFASVIATICSIGGYVVGHARHG